jgi:ligand-binding sensor domain-containing protein/signal transduction histidine kinase
LAGLIWLCCVRSASAIDPSLMVSQYMRASWGTRNGFPGGVVNSFAQTPDGYLWIGTDKGLVRFDGVNFRNFDQAAPSSFAIGPVQKLLTDPQGDLWILLQSTKLLRYRDGAFELSRGEAENGVTAMGSERSGAVLLSSVALGPLVFNGEHFMSASQPGGMAEAPRSEDPAWLSTSLAWSTGLRPHRLAAPASAVTSIVETADGKVWMGTVDRGLFYLSDGKAYAAGNGSPGPQMSGVQITCLLALEGQGLMIGTNKGLFRWNGVELNRIQAPASSPEVEVRSLIRDRDSNIWVGTARGLMRVRPDEISLDRQHGGSSEPVTALFEDRERGLWVGHSNGMERLRDGVFVSNAVAKKPESSGPVYVDQHGRAWLGPVEGGLHWLKGDQRGVFTGGGLASDVVYSITGREGELWIGRQRGGLTLLRDDEGPVTVRTYTHSDGLAQNSVYALHESGDGTVWAGTLSGGVSELKDGRFATFTTANGLSSNTVTSIAEGADGTLWFATPNGLSVLSKGSWRVLTTHDGLPSPDLNCVLAGSKGLIWIGSSAGLAYLVSDGVTSAQPIHVPRDPPDSLREPVFGIAEDQSGWLWIATSNHILRVRRDRLLSGSLDPEDVREYGPADGLSGTEGVKRDHSVFADTAGRVWVSTNRGVSVVSPSRMAGLEVPALVHVESVAADGNTVGTAGPVSIPSARQRVTFSFVGLSLADTERVRYRYRLDGFDHDWSEPVAARTAVYTNLRPGSYRFRVIACNSNGVWNDQEATLDLTVTPAWFQTDWFLALCVVSILSIVVLLYSLRVRRISQALSARFDERLAERTRLARELHDTLLQTIQGSKMVADDALDEATDLPRMRRAMEQLAGWLGQATQEGRAALHSLRTSTIQTNDLANSFRQALDRCLLQGFPEAVFIGAGTASDMHPIVRDEIYRIGYEAIRNAVQHSGGSRLEVHLSYAQELTLKVFDNGKGMAPDIAASGREGHFGLQGMRERALRIGARLTISSSVESGTRVQLVVPGSIVFRNKRPVSGAGFARVRSLLKRPYRSGDVGS